MKKILVFILIANFIFAMPIPSSVPIQKVAEHEGGIESAEATAYTIATVVFVAWVYIMFATKEDSDGETFGDIYF
jgi:hypothetical protein